MFAGEGTPERTNRRFHYLAGGHAAARLSTAFDSTTLYGEDPDERPDIYGKIGNSGVSIATLDDMKKLYSGFDLCAPTTSVSMTINGPAPMILAMFMNTAIDQQVEKSPARDGAVGRGRAEDRAAATKAASARATRARCPRATTASASGCSASPATSSSTPRPTQKIRRETLSLVRGTVQADILKEDQAQNTCIFSTEFALRMMGDVQQFFVDNDVRNFYSVSISGYHIAEAGANPISQLAFTLANGFTIVEYYLARGMKIDDFAPNLSFFFSNGMDPEYAVIGRVARRIWARAMRERYGAGPRSQMLKYHIQTSGRSLHAQEIQFNDIRTTLQALYALFDNCNSLHTNAYDEAITTPTEESVRRAVAIQLIINKELGLNMNRTPGRAPSRRPAHRPRRGSGLRSSSASPSAAACSARWRRCTSAARSRKSRSTTSRRSTTARCRSSASTRSSPRTTRRTRIRERGADPLDRRGEAGPGHGRARVPRAQRGAPPGRARAAAADGGERAATCSRDLMEAVKVASLGRSRARCTRSAGSTGAACSTRLDAAMRRLAPHRASDAAAAHASTADGFLAGPSRNRTLRAEPPGMRFTASRLANPSGGGAGRAQPLLAQLSELARGRVNAGRVPCCAARGRARRVARGSTRARRRAGARASRRARRSAAAPRRRCAPGVARTCPLGSARRAP